MKPKNRNANGKRGEEASAKKLALIGAAIGVAAVILGIALFVAGHRAPVTGPAAAASSSLANGVSFHDLESQMKEFIRYERTIELTPEQEAIKKAALERTPAVCCDDYTAYTCCCNCNLSKSLWGLANYLIAVHGMNAEQVSEAAGRWIAFTNPSGYTGNACYTGGCGRAPHANGCGGMDESDVVA